MRGMRTFVGLAAVAALLAGCGSSDDDSGLLEQPAGTLEGGASSLEEQIGGQWAVVNFWASFCEPCVREMPALQQLTEQHQIRVVGVNAADRVEFALKTIEETGVTYPIITDERGDLMAAAQVRSLPGTLIISPDGDIAARHAGELALEEMLELLEEAGYEQP